MPNMTDYQHIVNAAIKKLGLSSEKCQTTDTVWEIKRGSVTIVLELFKANNRTYFKVQALIAYLPNEQSTDFYKKLLLHNHDFNGFGFTLNDSIIYLKAVRDALGMDMNEAFVLITKVGNHADKFDDEIQSLL